MFRIMDRDSDRGIGDVANRIWPIIVTIKVFRMIETVKITRAKQKK